ncbi:hypothetical protein AB0E69_23580 [Kribbella sp. NPDC026611]|uniref:hypothetical protein n=1 Tax=Kribbella sp. NPDC026611 TaxID=3154911 RepID=UPI0033CC0F84
MVQDRRRRGRGLVGGCLWGWRDVRFEGDGDDDRYGDHHSHGDEHPHGDGDF